MSSWHDFPILNSFRKVKKVLFVQDLKYRQNAVGVIKATPEISSKVIGLL